MYIISEVKRLIKLLLYSSRKSFIRTKLFFYNYFLYILEYHHKSFGKRVENISNLDPSKEYLACVACLSRFKSNIDCNPEKLIRSVIKSENYQKVFIAFRIDKSDNTFFYKRLFNKYSKKIDMCLIIGRNASSRYDFPTFWEETFQYLRKYNFIWYQLTSDDSYFMRKDWIVKFEDFSKDKKLLMVSDVMLNYPSKTWYLDKDGKRIDIYQPPTVNYPAIKSDVLSFLSTEFPNDPLFGPNMSSDTYWGMVFGDSPYYICFHSYILRAPQLNSFIDSADSNNLRKMSLFENSTKKYREKGISILNALIHKYNL